VATLVITSDVDQDPLGLLRSPAERRQAFDALAPGSGWLLNLGGVPHAALAGTLAPDGWHEQDQQHGLMGAAMGGGRGGGGGPQGPAGGGARGPRSGSATEAALSDLGDGLRLSRAFLDARLRGAAMPASAQLSAR
jgi:hypothetical protein